MPIAYSFNSANALLEVQATGHVSIVDRAEFVAKAVTDRALPPEAPILIDASQLSNAPTVADVPRMARLVEMLADRFKSRIAYFVTGVGLVTPYMLASTQVEEQRAVARTFTNRAEAVDWLKAE